MKNTKTFIAPGIANRKHPMASLCIPAITEGELRFGLARRPDAVRLQALVEEFLARVDVLPWDRASAACYVTQPMRPSVG